MEAAATRPRLVGQRRSCGPVLTPAGPKLFCPPYTGALFLIRAGLSRRQLGWRGDLCAGVPAASGAGVPALPARRAAPRGVPARLPVAVRQGARPAAGGGGAGAARVPQVRFGRAWLRKGRMSDLPSELLGPVFLPGAKLLPVM